MIQNDVGVFPSNEVLRLGQDKDGNLIKRYGNYLSVADALVGNYATAAAVTPYVILNGESAPLVLKLHPVDSRKFLPETATVVVTCLFMDIDRDPHTAWDTDEVEDAQGNKGFDRAAALLDALVEELGCAGYVTQSGIRLVFKLDEYVPADNWKTIHDKLYTPISTKAQRIVGPGFIFDTSSSEWTRMYVLPNVVKASGFKTAPIAHLRIPIDWETLKLPDEQAMVEKADESQPSGPVITKVSKAALCGRLAGVGTFKRNTALIDKLAAGEAFYEEGNRNKAIYATTNMLFDALYMLYRIPPKPSLVYSILYDSVSVGSVTTDPGASLDEAWSIVTRKYEQVYADYAKDKSHIAAMDSLNKEEGTATNPPLLFLGSKEYYIYDPDKNLYVLVNNRDAVFGLLEKATRKRGLPIRTKTGAYLSMPEILNRFAKQIKVVTYRMNSKESRYDPEHMSLELSCAEPSDIPAEYDEEIATWLNFLGGKHIEDQEALLDWLATLTDLHKPTCALYLKTSGGTGKGMLAAGIAAFWRGSPVKFKEAISKHNDGLINMPVVWVDETCGLKGAGYSGEFKNLTTQLLNRVEPKFCASATLMGYIRCLVTSNDDYALPLSDNKEETGRDSITVRVRYIDCGMEPKEYLDALGGNDYTMTERSWVSYPDGSPGRLPRHIAWLIANRKVVPGKRLLVEGRRTIWHDKILVSDEREDIALAMIKALFVGDNSAFIRPDVEKQLIYLYAAGFHSALTRLTGVSKEIRLQALKDALKMFSPIDTQRVIRMANGTSRCAVFNAAEVIRYARIADSEYCVDLEEMFGVSQ